MRLQILLILLLSTPFAVAQGPIPDTTSAHRYAPMEIGNEWHYTQRSGPDQEVVGLQVWSVPADSVIEGETCLRLDQRRYTPDGYPAPNNHLRFSYVVFDDEAYNLRFCDVPGMHHPWELLTECPLSLDFEEEYLCDESSNMWVWVSSPDSVVTIGSETISTVVKGFDTAALEGYHIFAADIGLTSYTMFLERMELSFARIGDVEYGSPFVLSTTSPPEEVEASLSVFPNPAADRATVAFAIAGNHEVSLDVFDLLGRRLMRVDLGTRATGEHQAALDLRNLPAGLYLVRLNGGAGATAHLIKR